MSNHCKWQGRSDAEKTECGNTQDMLHGGVLPLSFCQNECPYQKPEDYFSANAKLTESVAYRPAPASCGGCGTVKRREAVTQFVWPYWHGGANGDEIRFSVRSVETFFHGQVKCTIVGDRPPWYQGHVIHQPQIPLRENHGFRDMLAKMWVMATHAEIDADFVWMMDDIYLLKPVTWDDLETPRAYPWQEDQLIFMARHQRKRHRKHGIFTSFRNPSVAPLPFALRLNIGVQNQRILLGIHTHSATFHKSKQLQLRGITTGRIKKMTPTYRTDELNV